MWAAIKSDFKEFVSTAAEETNAVTNKVVSKASESAGLVGGGTAETGGGGGGWAGKAGAALSSVSGTVEGVGASVRGLSSMIGGVVAPVHGGGVDDKNASALLQSDEEEEELGWDDDEDELDVEELTEDVPQDSSEEKIERKEEVKLVLSDGDDSKEILAALQAKLSEVEKSRSELQSEHRRQTAELVELRSKVNELESKDTAETGETSSDNEVQALREEIAQLKLQLEQSGEHVNLNPNNDEENTKLLEQYQQQIKELTSELEALQQKFQASDAELAQVKEQSTHTETQLNSLLKEKEQQLRTAQNHTSKLEQDLVDAEATYARALQELSQANERIAQLEGETCRLEREMEVQAVNFEKAKITAVSEAAVAVPKEDDSGEISSGEKIVAEESFVTAKGAGSPRLKVGVEDDEESDWGDGAWGDED